MKIKDAAPVQDSRKQQLLEDIARTKSALDRAYSNFENVIDPDLIDSSIYELQSIQRLCFSGCPDRIDQFHR